MDQWKHSEGFYQPAVPGEHLSGSGFVQPAEDVCGPSGGLPSSCPDSSQMREQGIKDPMAARKVQKADREKLRRDRLNEQFLELGNALDPDRPKNDKATILADTIQMLKDLTAQVNRLKAEYTSLSDESRELTQEKNELREEKATLKSEIDSLNAQYQQRLRVMFPWATLEPSVVMGPPQPYPFPMPVPIPSGPIPMHPSLQPYPFFRGQNPGSIPNPCPAYVSYPNPCNHQAEQPLSHRSPNPQPSNGKSHTSGKHDSGSKLPDRQCRSGAEKSDDFSDVATELELKTPGSSIPAPESARGQVSLEVGKLYSYRCILCLVTSTAMHESLCQQFVDLAYETKHHEYANKMTCLSAFSSSCLKLYFVWSCGSGMPLSWRLGMLFGAQRYHPRGRKADCGNPRGKLAALRKGAVQADVLPLMACKIARPAMRAMGL